MWSKQGAKFVHGDRLLDAASTGPKWLLEPAVADIVAETLHSGRKDFEYELGSWVVMPNHVHPVIRPQHGLSQTVRRIKGKSARRANEHRGCTGEPFWARDYYDHWIRNREEEQRISRYIENSPVKAGLCGSAGEWIWSSASRG